MDILGEDGGHRQGILGAQDHRAWAPGDSWGWWGENEGQTESMRTDRFRLQNLPSVSRVSVVSQPPSQAREGEAHKPTGTVSRLGGDAGALWGGAGDGGAQRGGAQRVSLEGKETGWAVDAPGAVS